MQKNILLLFDFITLFVSRPYETLTKFHIKHSILGNNQIYLENYLNYLNYLNKYLFIKIYQVIFR